MNKRDGYDVVIVRGTPRFRLDNKLIARDKVPTVIQDQLLAIKADKEAVRTVDAAPDLAATFTTEQPTPLPVELEEESGDNPYIEAGAPEVFPEPEPQLKDGDFIEVTFTTLELELLEKVTALERQIIESAEQSSNDTPKSLGEKLLSQYGVYTALAPRDPQIGDIHPYTLKPMNRYDVGLAYVERKKSVNVEVSAPVVHEAPQENPKTEAENGGFQSFDTRTGVSFGAQSSTHLTHHTNDPISEEATTEPNLRATTIRPYW